MVIWYFFMHKTPEFNNVNNALMIFIITSLKKIWSFDNIWIEIIKVLTFQSNYLKTKLLLTIWIYTQFHVVNIFFCHLTFRVYIEINWSAQYKNWQIVPFYTSNWLKTKSSDLDKGEWVVGRRNGDKGYFSQTKLKLK